MILVLFFVLFLDVKNSTFFPQTRRKVFNNLHGSAGSNVINVFSWELWKRENIGIYVDEGTMVTGMGGFNACLTQGRSKQIPMIVCTQRPVSVSRWLFSEASFYMLFPLTDERDRKTVSSFVPVNLDTYGASRLQLLLL